MYLTYPIDILSFLNTVKTCKGNVFFRTKEGDSLNLNSLLSQFILHPSYVTNIFSSPVKSIVKTRRTIILSKIIWLMLLLPETEFPIFF